MLENIIAGLCSSTYGNRYLTIDYTRKNLTTCSRSAKKPNLSTTCSKSCEHNSTSSEQAVNNL